MIGKTFEYDDTMERFDLELIDDRPRDLVCPRTDKLEFQIIDHGQYLTEFILNNDSHSDYRSI